MENSNCEFKKILSLNFIYKVSKEGRSFRNVRSNKESNFLVDYSHSEKGCRYTFVNIKGYKQRVSITKVVAETFISQSKDVQHVCLINKEGKEIYFDSKAAAARALAKEYGVSVEQIRSKLKKKRSHIYGYDVRYD